MAAATSVGDSEGEGDTGEAEHTSANRYPTRRSAAVTSKPNATTKKPTTATAKKPTFGNLTTTLKPATTSKLTDTLKPTTRSQKVVVGDELGSQANRKTGTGSPAKVKRKTGTKVKMEAKMKAPRKKRQSVGGKGEKQIKISDQKWQNMKGFGSFIGEYEAERLRS